MLASRGPSATAGLLVDITYAYTQSRRPLGSRSRLDVGDNYMPNAEQKSKTSGGVPDFILSILQQDVSHPAAEYGPNHGHLGVDVLGLTLPLSAGCTWISPRSSH